MIDEILAQGPAGARLLRLQELLTLLFGASLLWALASFLRLYFAGLAGSYMIRDLRHDLFGHIQKMSLDFFEKRKAGSIVSWMMNDVAAAQQFVGLGMTATLMDLSSCLVIALILFRLHWKLALLSFAVLPLYAALSKHFGKSIRQISREAQQKAETLAGNLQEKISGINVVQAFSSEAKEEGAFRQDVSSHFRSLLRNVKQQSLALSLTGFLALVAPLFVLGYGALCVIRETLTVGELIAFYGYIGLFYAPVARLTELHVVLANSLAAMDRLFEVFDTAPTVQEKKKALRLEEARGQVSFVNVSFSYPSGKRVLQELNFEIPPGQSVALLGPSGSGKSTVAKLMCRFYDVSQGAILMDGIDIRDLTLSSLRHQVAVVEQEPRLFSGTILENIRYGREEARLEEVIEAAQSAYAHEFILRRPRQYETQVGEHGALLSIGEKQRIAIARALLRDPSILILDEFTSGLDVNSASIIQASLRERRKGKTTLWIAHELSGRAAALDRTLWLAEGKCLETPYLEAHS